MKNKKRKEWLPKSFDRLLYACRLLDKNEIEYKVYDIEKGHIQVWEKATDKMHNFWAGTGMIDEKNFPKRGIHNLIEMCK